MLITPATKVDALVSRCHRHHDPQPPDGRVRYRRERLQSAAVFFYPPIVAIPEGALQGFNDEVLDTDHAEFARTCAIDIPGPETDRLGRLARQCGVFITPQAKARYEDWPDRFLSVGFVVDPDGAVILGWSGAKNVRCARSGLSSVQ